MKNIQAIAVLVLLLSNIGCQMAPDEHNVLSPVRKELKLKLQDCCVTICQIVVIDGCQYIVTQGHHFGEYSFCHKGDCSNPIHWENASSYLQGHIDTSFSKPKSPLHDASNHLVK